MKRWFDVLWLVFWAALSAAYCLTAAREQSCTFDEAFYLREGLTSFHTGSHWGLMRAGTTPLPMDVQYGPIYLWEKARGQDFDVNNWDDFHTILPYARAMNLVFWGLLLLYGMLVARVYGGPWAGRFAVPLIATEPSLLGHASLATTDIAISALILVFIFHYVRGRDGGRWRRWVLPGLLFGLALTAKVSALTFVPLLMIALEVPRWYAAGVFARPAAGGRIRHVWRGVRPFVGDLIKVFLIGSAFLWGYCGTDWKPQQSFVKEADKLPDDHPWKSEMTYWSRTLRVFPNAGEALAYQIKHNIRGHASVLNGVFFRRALWYYYPVALTIKLTVIVLGLLAVLLVTRPRALATPVGLMALVLLLFSLNTRVQIGIRIVFPLVVLLLLTLAVGLARATEAWQGRVRGGLLILLAGACCYPPLSAWPDGLRYGNELWGGTETVYEHLGESNYDWGQGLIDLEKWRVARGLPEPKVWYYGKDPVVAMNPDRRLQLEWTTFRLESPEDTWKYVEGQVVAVGVGYLYGNRTISPHQIHAVEFFLARKPIGKTRTFFVYDFRQPP